jgi:hypothetical protein
MVGPAGPASTLGYGGAGLTVEVVNLDRVLMAFGELADEIADAAQVAAVKEAKVVFVKTQHRVPWYTGQLHKSGRVEEGENEVGERTAVIAYGGPAGAGRNTEDVDYALIVHEDLEAVHLFGRSAKYVEGPVREEMESGRSADRMGATIRARMGWE